MSSRSETADHGQRLYEYGRTLWGIRGPRAAQRRFARRAERSQFASANAEAWNGRSVIFSRAASSHAWCTARLVWSRSLWQTSRLPLHRERAIEPLRFAFEGRTDFAASSIAIAHRRSFARGDSGPSR